MTEWASEQVIVVRFTSSASDAMRLKQLMEIVCAAFTKSEEPGGKRAVAQPGEERP